MCVFGFVFGSEIIRRLSTTTRMGTVLTMITWTNRRRQWLRWAFSDFYCTTSSRKCSRSRACTRPGLAQPSEWASRATATAVRWCWRPGISRRRRWRAGLRSRTHWTCSQYPVTRWPKSGSRSRTRRIQNKIIENTFMHVCKLHRIYYNCFILLTYCNTNK